MDGIGTISIGGCTPLYTFTVQLCITFAIVDRAGDCEATAMEAPLTTPLSDNTDSENEVDKMLEQWRFCMRGDSGQNSSIGGRSGSSMW